MTMSRRFPHHEHVVALLPILQTAWAKAEPNSPEALYPASYHESFLDMARAAVNAGFRMETDPEPNDPEVSRG